MKTLLLKLVIFSFLINLSVGIMLGAIPGFSNKIDLAAGLSTDTVTVNENTLDEFSGSINSANNVEDKSDILDRLLDKIGLGIVKKALSFLDYWMFGLVNMIRSIFGGFLSDSLSSLIFNGMKFLITLLYISFGVYMFTGKSLE